MSNTEGITGLAVTASNGKVMPALALDITKQSFILRILRGRIAELGRHFFEKHGSV